MTDIPDDVVERALAAFDSLPALDHSVEDMMRAAGRVFVEWERKQFKASLDLWMNNYLCDMKPDYDDSITGFNEAWDVVRAAIRARSSMANFPPETGP